MSVLYSPFSARRRRFSVEAGESLAALCDQDSSLPVESRRTEKIVTVTFQVDTCGKAASRIVLLGSCKELGRWHPLKALKLTTSAMTFPVWVSEPVAFAVTGESLELEYKFGEMSEGSEAVTFESFSGNRRLQFNTKMVRSMEFLAENIFNTPSDVQVNSCEGFSLLQSLEGSETLTDSFTTMLAYLSKKGSSTTLKDFLSICHFFKTLSLSETSVGEEDVPLVMKLSEALLRITTAEVTPLLHMTLESMSRCCPRFRATMKSITDAKIVRKGRLQGCKSQALEDVLDQYFDSSPRPEQAILRVIALNSVRRVLKQLKSAQPVLLALYDCWLLQLQASLIETQLLSRRSLSLGSLLDEVTVVTESLALSHICPQMARLASDLSAQEDLGVVRETLVKMVETGTMWLSQYLHAASGLGKKDYICIRNFLIEVGADSVRLLFPTISRALLAVCDKLGKRLSLGVCTGRAVGKVLVVDSLEDVPRSFSSVIAVVRCSRMRENRVPANVRGIVRVGDSYVCSQLVAHCLHHDIVLGFTSCIDDSLEQKVEVRVETNSVVFL